MSTQNTNQKQSSINQNSKKNFRGSYKKIKFQVKLEILERLKSNQETLSEIAKDLNINVETIRSLYKNKAIKTYIKIQKFILYANAFSNKSWQVNNLKKLKYRSLLNKKLTITKTINNFVESQMISIINDFNPNQEQKSVIEFNSKIEEQLRKLQVLQFQPGNKRLQIILKLKKYPRKFQRTITIILSYHSPLITLFLDNYEFSQQPLEQDSSMNWFNQQTETRPFGEIIFE